jgi:hypothetical protein
MFTVCGIVFLSAPLISDEITSIIAFEPITYETAEEKNEIIKSKIIWDTEYSQELETVVIDEFNKVPEHIFNSWLNVADSAITICPNVLGYIEENYSPRPDGGAPLAGNIKMKLTNSKMKSARIHVLGSADYLQLSILHEIGHYVHAEYTGGSQVSLLPNYNTDAYAFAREECAGSTYYAKSHEEYFAEMFKYTVLNGVTDEYPDTYVIQEIIDNF